MGIKLKKRFLYTLQFADDHAVIGNDREDVEHVVRKLIEEYERWRLEVNTKKKTKCIGGRESGNGRQQRSENLQGI